MDLSLGVVEFSSVKSKWLKTKSRIALAPRRTTFTSTSTKITPWSLWLFGRFGYLWKIDLLGWTNFDITDATAPTTAWSFGDFGEIMSKSVKKRMGRWEVCLGTFPYEGIRRGSKIRSLNPVYARLKSKQIEILKPAGRGMYQGTLHYCTHETSEVWCTSTSKIESLNWNQLFFSILMYCSML